MKRLLLLVGFVVFWKQWEVANGMLIGTAIYQEPVLVQESQTYESLLEARNFVRRHKNDERYTDMHIYRVGEEVRP